MNPQQINRQALIKQFNFKQSAISNIDTLDTINTGESRDTINTLDTINTGESPIIDNLANNYKARLPVIYDRINKYSLASDTVKYIYKINEVINTDIISLTSKN